MKIMALVVFLMAALLLVTACGGGAPAPRSPGAPAPAPKEQFTTSEAQKLYDGKCGSCHAPDGRGGIQFGDVTSADLRQAEIEPIFHNDVALLSRAIMDGVDEDGEELNAAMPRFRGKLTDAEVQAIISFLLTLK